MRDKTSVEEIAKTFISKTMPEIWQNVEVPRFNIIFDDDDFKLLDNIIDKEDINKLRENSYISQEYPTIIVKDTTLFFNYLKDIVEETFTFFHENNNTYHMPFLIEVLLKYIWLRMGPNDFNNVEDFLKQQLEFIKDRSFFDELWKQSENVGEYLGNVIKARVYFNNLWYETTRHMHFYIMDNERKCHTLPMVHYDILEENGKKICYIYAIQNPDIRLVIPKINRLLYKLNKGVLDTESNEYLEYKNGNGSYYPENISDVPPSSLLSLLTFIDILEKHGINNIRVPLLQVMNYDYHILLSNIQKKEFPIIWSEEKIKNLSLSPNNHSEKDDLIEYKRAKEWYEHVVDKEDFISKTKTENLIRLFRRACFHKTDMEIRTGVFEEADYLDITLDKTKVKKKNRE